MSHTDTQGRVTSHGVNHAFKLVPVFRLNELVRADRRLQEVVDEICGEVNLSPTGAKTMLEHVLGAEAINGPMGQDWEDVKDQMVMMFGPGRHHRGAGGAFQLGNFLKKAASVAKTGLSIAQKHLGNAADIASQLGLTKTAAFLNKAHGIVNHPLLQAVTAPAAMDAMAEDGAGGQIVNYTRGGLLIGGRYIGGATRRHAARSPRRAISYDPDMMPARGAAKRYGRI